MKKIIYAIIVILFWGGMYACTQWDEYKKYIDEEIIYPQKPDSLKTYPGKNRILLEWTIADPKVSSCKVFYNQEGIQDSVIVPVNAEHNYSNDTIRTVIENLIESNCIFNVISYDNLGHSSLTVEAEEFVYGENYEKSLINRTLRSRFVDTDGLHLQWYPATDETELEIEINYTDNQGNQKTVFVADSVIANTIADFNVNYPFTYRTSYLPTTTAIDTFYSSLIEDQITFPSGLVNSEAPFEITDRGWWFNGRFGDLYGWIVNDAAAANGTVDNYRAYCMVFWTWAAYNYSPSPTISNGKIYQTISLSPGTYSFKATVKYISTSVDEVYLAVNTGLSLPDVDNVEKEAISYTTVSPGLVEGTVIECEFTIESSVVGSLGLVGNSSNQNEIVFKKFELIEK